MDTEPALGQRTGVHRAAKPPRASHPGQPNEQDGSVRGRALGGRRSKHRRPGAIAISSTLEAMVMTNVLIRGLSHTAVERIDAEAAAQGLSRNEFLRRKLEETTSRAWRLQ